MNLQKKAVEYFLVEYSTTFLHRRLYSYSFRLSIFKM